MVIGLDNWIAMAPVYTTVIGQCMGARDIDSANFYFKKLNKITFALSVLWNALVFAITPLIIKYLFGYFGRGKIPCYMACSY